MKINKKNPAHWCYLGVFGLNVVAAIALRPFRPSNSRQQVVLYGHKLNGNLLAIYRYLRTHTEAGIDPVFLTMDPAYYRVLNRDRTAVASALTPRCAWLLACADAVIADRGIHAMQPMLRFSNLKFFDVWHGIPFKGFDADDFRVQHRFTETWVASPLLADIYINRFGFPPDKVKVTGYARTDRLVNQTEDTSELRKQFDLPATGKIVLVAPTWQQDDSGRSIYPFGCPAEEFYTTLAAVADSTGATFVTRAHLNSAGQRAVGGNSEHASILHRSHGDYPDTEGLLLVTDVLVVDWSSIAFDFLLLGRPTIFLDVEAPFAKGFSLGSEYRFGDLVSSIEQLRERLERSLPSGTSELLASDNHYEDTSKAVYRDYKDGQSTARCVGRLQSACY